MAQSYDEGYLFGTTMAFNDKCVLKRAIPETSGRHLRLVPLDGPRRLRPR